MKININKGSAVVSLDGDYIHVEWPAPAMDPDEGIPAMGAGWKISHDNPRLGEFLRLCLTAETSAEVDAWINAPR